MLNAVITSIPDVVVLEPTVHRDERGFFFESFNQRQFDEAIGRPIRFVQDNHTKSSGGVVRGLHYQVAHPQGKLIRVCAGEVFDVAVDLREQSQTFGQWVGEYISAENKKQLWIPEGFAHGFFVISDYAELIYKVTEYWMPEHERCVKWNDSALKITWPRTAGGAIVSARDALGTTLDQAEVFVQPSDAR